MHTMSNTTVRPQDRDAVRDLARRYDEICHEDVQAPRRDLWRRHNSLTRTRPLIYVRAFAWGEMSESRLACEDPFCRRWEDFFRRMLFWHALDDDSVFEPWVTVDAVRAWPPDGVWGLPTRWIAGPDPRGAKKIDPAIKSPEDARRMVVPRHQVDEEATAREAARTHELFGDIVPVAVSRAPIWRMWNGDISTQLAYLRGVDGMMWDMMDRPAWLREVLAFMRDGILKAHEEAEQAGHWSLLDHQNQAMPYAEELRDPAPEGTGVLRRDLWHFCASQETTLVGPEMFWEFMLQYQLPIVEKFGLLAYGCCEDLTRKIPYLRRIPNLRRIAVSPMADVRKCAEQIGTDYVLSYRPSPAEMVSCGFDPDYVRTKLRNDLEGCRECHVDITLKDVETVQNDPTRVKKWVRITREVIDEIGW